MEKNLKLPERERHKFSQPLGKLIEGTREETIPHVEKLIETYIASGFVINFYLVGDIVTKDFLANDFLKRFIKLCIVDEKTRRNYVKISFEEFFEEIIKFENPEGSIKKESFKLLEGIIDSNKKTLLKITDGEEDLLVIPVVLGLPIIEKVKNFVFYGQPPITSSKHSIPEGLVMVDVNKRIQKAVRKFISLMEIL